MKSEFEIARIVKPRGLKGEMKVEFYSSDVGRLSRLIRVKLDGEEREIEKISADGAYGFIKLAGVDGVEVAELLRGRSLYANREDLPEPEDGEHYIVDIIGLFVIVDGECIGRVSDVLQYGSADVYVVKSEKSSLSFPALERVITGIDLKGGRITLNKEAFDSVVVYN